VQSMHPVLHVGSYGWDQEWLPLDEFGERIRAVRRVMDAQGWDGLLFHGDCQQCSLLTYLTNFFPRVRWALGLLARKGDPTLLVAGGIRDLPAAAELTWVRDVRSYGDTGKIVPDWAKTLGAQGRPKIGLYGSSFMRTEVHQTVTKTLAGCAEAIEADGLLDPLMRRKRPREGRMIRLSAGILDKVSKALAATFRAGETLTDAAVEAERVARFSGAQDIRILVSLDGGRTLQPFFRMKNHRGDVLVAYIAVRYLGYWSEGMVTVAAQPSAAARAAVLAVDAMVATAKPGATGAQLAAAAAKHLKALAPHPILEGRVGHGIGLALDEYPLLAAGSEIALEVGGVYSLRAGANDPNAGAALSSAMIALTASGTEILWSATGS
jgi:Xaa-Pro aminopeptidase